MKAIGRAVALGLAASASVAAAAEPSTAYDGRWFVSLDCADTHDRKGDFVKGYAFEFFVVVKDGRLTGQRGEAGKPSSVVYDGAVAADGTVEIRATGNTGRSEYAMGHIAQGSAYDYTLTGRIDGTKGTLVRRETRPCTATIARRP